MTRSIDKRQANKLARATIARLIADYMNTGSVVEEFGDDEKSADAFSRALEKWLEYFERGQ